MVGVAVLGRVVQWSLCGPPSPVAVRGPPYPVRHDPTYAARSDHCVRPRTGEGTVRLDEPRSQVSDTAPIGANCSLRLDARETA